MKQNEGLASERRCDEGLASERRSDEGLASERRVRIKTWINGMGRDVFHST